MKIKYISDYLSIKQFEDIELNDFTVITGVNGAGKSHFLNAINNGNIKIEGIDSENIVMYNYNDFNVVNVDLNQTNNNNNSSSELINKHKIFLNKSQTASQKFNEKRNNILNSFNINRQYDSIFIDDELQNNLNNFDIFNWSEEDKEYYQNFDVNNPDTNYTNYSKILNFHYYISNYQYHKISDINNFINFLNVQLPKIQSLNIVRNFGYNKEFKFVNEEKFREVFEIVKGNPQFEFWNDKNRNEYPYFILDIIENLTHSFPNWININPQLLVKSIKEVYEEIEDYFKSEIDADTLKLIQIINGDNVLDSISFDNGFFNLNDIALEEKSYQLHVKQNDINKFLRSEGQNVHTYNDEDLIKYFGESPIKILNDVLNVYDVNGYEFRNSNLQLDIHNGMQNQNIHIYLFNKNENFQTNLDALSSGEKTLLALAFSIYKLKKNKILAKVLLMDELDSALHPSMSKRLVNVLYKYFYKTLGVKIIISSHSPSTIAFSPDDSLYIIKKDKTSKLLHHVSKDDALKELTIGVPSFSINYENRKQVFVESKYDAQYYGQLYDIFKNYLNNEISLNFIGSGDVQKDKNGQPISNCKVVIEITEKLRDAGNKSIYGIIDWDLAKNKVNNPYVITLGFYSRYSIENYIFDPLIVGIFLLKEKILKPEYFGFDNNFKLKSLFNLDIENCQNIINKICDDIISKIKMENIITFINKNNADTINNENICIPHTYKTINDFELNIPYFIKVLQGHQLEKYLLQIYPEFNAYSKGKEDLLKKEFIKIVIEDFIEYTPKDLLDVFIEIQK